MRKTDRLRTLVFALLAATVWAPSALCAADAALWSRTYDGPGHGQDEATSLAVFGDFVYTAGTLRTVEGDDDAVAYCHRKDGTLVWSFRAGTAGQGMEDYFHDVAVDEAGNPYVLAFFTTDPGNDAGKIRVYRFHPQDNGVAWSRDLLPGGYDSAQAFRMAYRDNAVVLAGSARRSGGGSDLYVASISTDNVLRWETLLDPSNGGDDFGNFVALSENAVFVAGTATGQESDVYLARLRSTDGGKVWDKTVSNPGGDDVNHLRVSGESLFVSATLASSSPGGDDRVAALFRFSAADGSESWRKTKGRGIPSAVNGAVGSASAPGVVAFTGFLGGDDKDTFVDAFLDNGDLLWSRNLGTTGRDDAPTAIVFDGTRWVVLGAYPKDAQTEAAIGVKFLGTDGSPAGTVLFAKTGAAQDFPIAGAADGAGNVFLAGRASVGTDFDFFVGKIGPAPSSGSGGGWCGISHAPDRSPTPPWEWGAVLLPAVFLGTRRALRKRVCNIRRTGR